MTIRTKAGADTVLNFKKGGAKYIEAAFCFGYYQNGYQVATGKTIVYNPDNLTNQNLLNAVGGYFSTGWHLICSGNVSGVTYRYPNTYQSSGTLLGYAIMY